MTHTPDEVLEWTNGQIREWLDSRPSDGVVAWLALGEAAAMAANTASRDIPASRREILGELAIHALHMAASHDPSTSNGTLLSEVVLRSGLIHKLGEEPGSVRDASTLWDLIEGVLERAEVHRRHVEHGPADLRTLTVEEILGLRRAKSILGSAELVLGTSGIRRPSRVEWWWSRRADLP